MNNGRTAARSPRLALGALVLSAIFSTSANAQLSYSNDFEAPDALSADGWQVFVNYFEPDCTTYVSSPYGFPAGDNGPQASALAQGQSSQVVNIYSNYDDPAHTTTCLETNVFLSFGVSADDAGDYSFSYEVENPPEAQFTGDKVNGFVRIFNGDFSAVLFEAVVPSTPGIKAVEFSIDAGMAGGVLQFGFNNYAFNYEASGMYYDNVNLEEISAPPPPPPPPPAPDPQPPAQPIPSTSALGNVLLVFLLGILGAGAIMRRLG